MKCKKGLISVILVCSIGVLFTGCEANTTEGVTKESRFVTTTDTYRINDGTYKIIYDIKTDNVYLSSRSDFSIFPLLDEVGVPVKYKDLK